MIEVSNSPRGFGFKKVITCLVPVYNGVSSKDYMSRFEKILGEIFKKGKNFIFAFSQTH